MFRCFRWFIILPRKAVDGPESHSSVRQLFSLCHNDLQVMWHFMEPVGGPSLQALARNWPKLLPKKNSASSGKRIHNSWIRTPINLWKVLNALPCRHSANLPGIRPLCCRTSSILVPSPMTANNKLKAWGRIVCITVSCLLLQKWICLITNIHTRCIRSWNKLNNRKPVLGGSPVNKVCTL